MDHSKKHLPKRHQYQGVFKSHDCAPTLYTGNMESLGVLQACCDYYNIQEDIFVMLGIQEKEKKLFRYSDLHRFKRESKRMYEVNLNTTKSERKNPP